MFGHKKKQFGKQDYEYLGTYHGLANTTEGDIPKWILDWIRKIPNQVKLHDAAHDSRHGACIQIRGWHFKYLLCPAGQSGELVEVYGRLRNRYVN